MQKPFRICVGSALYVHWIEKAPIHNHTHARNYINALFRLTIHCRQTAKTMRTTTATTATTNTFITNFEDSIICIRIALHSFHFSFSFLRQSFLCRPCRSTDSPPRLSFVVLDRLQPSNFIHSSFLMEKFTNYLLFFSPFSFSFLVEFFDLAVRIERRNKSIIQRALPQCDRQVCECANECQKTE